jgi:hypothetical protein
MAALASQDPSQLSRALFAAINGHDFMRLKSLLHPDAQLQMAIADRQVVEGRAAILAALKASWPAVHDLQIDELHPLSEHAVIIVGRSRLPTDPGLQASRCVWLCEYRENMLWRQRLFYTLAEARGALLSP